ncbi:hypothetical protein [Cyclobacterium plantarum]|uniref:hypothetical protein n=1 Tax=Cyclobacterium plantarum TaxID=2716263 RepID=UPI003F725C18
MIGIGLATPMTNDQAVKTLLSVGQVNFEAGAHFQINSEGKVSGFVLSGQNFENIRFLKLKKYDANQVKNW